MTKRTSRSEAQIVRDILGALRSLGGFWVKVHGGPYQTTGLPDVIGCLDGHFYAFEVKRPDRLNTLSPRQRLTLDKLSAAGAYTAVVVSKEETIEFIAKMRVYAKGIV
jgi:Holliday junction resolvase